MLKKSGLKLCGNSVEGNSFPNHLVTNSIFPQGPVGFTSEGNRAGDTQIVQMKGRSIIYISIE